MKNKRVKLTVTNKNKIQEEKEVETAMEAKKIFSAEDAVEDSALIKGTNIIKPENAECCQDKVTVKTITNRRLKIKKDTEPLIDNTEFIINTTSTDKARLEPTNKLKESSIKEEKEEIPNSMKSRKIKLKHTSHKPVKDSVNVNSTKHPVSSITTETKKDIKEKEDNTSLINDIVNKAKKEVKSDEVIATAKVLRKIMSYSDDISLNDAFGIVMQLLTLSESINVYSKKVSTPRMSSIKKEKLNSTLKESSFIETDFSKTFDNMFLKSGEEVNLKAIISKDEKNTYEIVNISIGDLGKAMGRVYWKDEPFEQFMYQEALISALKILKINDSIIKEIEKASGSVKINSLENAVDYLCSFTLAELLGEEIGEETDEEIDAEISASLTEGYEDEISDLYFKLKKLFDTKLAKYDYIQNNEANAGLRGIKDEKIGFIHIYRDVYVKDNPTQANNDIKNLMNEVESIASKYEGKIMHQEDVEYVGQKAKLKIDLGNVRSECSIYLHFLENIKNAKDSAVKDEQMFEDSKVKVDEGCATTPHTRGKTIEESNNSYKLKEIADFLKYSVDSLQNGFTCSNLPLGDNLYVVFGWSYGEVSDPNMITSEGYSLRAMIACKFGYMDTDYDSDYVIPYNPYTGTLLVDDYPVRKNEDFEALAKRLLDDYNYLVDNFEINEDGEATHKK